MQVCTLNKCKVIIFGMVGLTEVDLKMGNINLKCVSKEKKEDKRVS